MIDSDILKPEIFIIDGTPCQSKCKKAKGDKSVIPSDPEAAFVAVPTGAKTGSLAINQLS